MRNWIEEGYILSLAFQVGKIDTNTARHSLNSTRIQKMYIECIKMGAFVRDIPPKKWDILDLAKRVLERNGSKRGRRPAHLSTNGLGAYHLCFPCPMLLRRLECFLHLKVGSNCSFTNSFQNNPLENMKMIINS